MIRRMSARAVGVLRSATDLRDEYLIPGYTSKERHNNRHNDHSCLLALEHGLLRRARHAANPTCVSEHRSPEGATINRGR